MTSMTTHGYRSNLEKAVQVVAREFFDSDTEKTTHEAIDSDELECVAYTPWPVVYGYRIAE